MATSESLPTPGTWQCPRLLGSPTERGRCYMWHDRTNDLIRVKSGSAPINEQDGERLVTGALAA